MPTTYLAVMLVAILANGFSGIGALLHIKAALRPMDRAGVPRSWMTFPIGTLKTAGAAGLLLGLAGVPHVGLAAAVGLTLFFVCAVHTHILAGDYAPQFWLALAFLATAVAAVTVNVGPYLGP
ncbi:DoxX family protein [Pseudonocardia sp. C8]|uniref:DoxX family protein n=1 Tax=Pseudonocardia sp. C8 TaxID=2762759 RepID=UPI00164247D5|nr:DoxX family protein [Pseudonocardia sp. C8]MBC3194637.1 DoxX family protein [Pseudonocardia sp. C8]